MPELDRLRWQLDVSWTLLTMHLDKVTDEEALWEPAANCWSVRPRPDGTWAADFAIPEPEPIPVLSAGWVMWHIGFWWSNAHRQCFEPTTEPFDWSSAAAATPWPGDVSSAVKWLTACHDRWAAALKPLTDADLDSTTQSTWFADGTLTLGHVIAWTNVELMKNAAELGALRHLHNADRC
ncbi:DinB family protein [Spongiactinospora sp. TRM90649]|uniref:DinB family protein n=1 Tax=Spongiactinospora sp. TRM90649 TaxID=3031114 RepID=UPI0023F96B86|nr:DinB family protein [Spongiactinospora sp. TRM90649]MDF5752830.1 DinB family protein [Spongiactinospora sp. TRM90649]